MQDYEKELAEIRARIKAKTKAVVDFAWLVIAAFLLVGSFTPFAEKAAFGMIVFTICWMFNQIIGRGIAATQVLFFSKKSDSDNTNNKEQ